MSNYSSNFPTQRPSLNLVFNGGSDQLDSRISFSRADTPPTYAAPSAVHYWSNEKHLSSENLLLQSQDFDTTWSGIHLGSSVSGGYSAPDGSSTGWLMTANTGTSQEPQLQQLFAVNSNTEYTAIAHLKVGTASHGYVSFRGGSGGHYAYAIIDFSAGTVADGGSGFTGISSSITALSDSWYKVTVTATSDSTTSAPYCFIGISDGSAFGSNGTAPYDSNGETMYAWGAQLSSTNSKVYDSPTTTQISRSYSSTLKSVSNAGDPRFEYDPTNGQSVGLLIEAQATSLITYSEDFSNSFYDKTRLSIDSNVAVAPDGSLTASAMRVDATAASSHRMRFTYATGGATAQTFSIFAKAGSKSWVALKFDSSGGAFDASIAYFNLSNGTTGTVDSGVTATINDCGNGWYRCSITRTALASATGQIELYVAEADNDSTIDGNSYDYILAWGAMVEANTSAPSSYIKSNSGSSTTRSADSCSVDLSQINYSGGDTSVIVDIPVGTGNGNLPYLFDLGGSNVEQMALYKASFTASASTNWSANAAGNGLSMSGSSASGTLGLRVSTDNFRADSSNSSAVTDSSITVSPWTSLHLGSTNAGNYRLNGHIKRVALYNVALSDTELQAITS